MIAIYLLIGLLVAGLAVKQMSFILMHGSIFEGLRHAIERRADGSSFFSKLQGLFGCKLCMCTQVGIWTVMIPAITLALKTGFLGIWGLMIAIYAGIILGMAVAAVALGMWNFLEFRPQKFEEQRRMYEDLLAGAKSQSQPVYSPRSASGARARVEIRPPSPDEFAAILASVDVACKGHRNGCGYARRSCREKALRSAIEQWWAENGNGRDDQYQLILQAIWTAVPEFYRLRWKYEKAEQVANFLRDIYGKVCGEIWSRARELATAA